MPELSISPTSNFEGTTTGSDPNALTWTISLDAPATSQVRVDYRLLAGTGSVGTVNNLSDVWRGVGGIENTLTFLPGETSQTVSFAIDADNVDETDEAVVLEVFNPEGATLAGDAPVLRATGWVLDDDGTGNDLALFVSRPVLVEGDTGETQASFEVSLSRPAPEAFTVTYTTLDGSAVAGEDYETTSGTLSFVEGQTSASVTVPVFGDTKIEPAELFTLDISKPAPAAAVSLGSAEIFDDDAGGDAQPTVNVSPTSNFEGTTTGSDPNALTWTISLDAPATSQVRVDYRLLAGTGSVGTVNNLSDVWRGVGGIENTLTFLPGETSQTVSFAIDADNVDETDEAVVLEVFNPEGATLAGDAPVLRATGWVLDDDGTGNDLALFVSRPVLVEGDTGETQASFEVSLSRPAPEAFTVTYTTLDGSAVAGEDYETTSGTLSFVEGQTSASVTVPVFGDTKIEPAELFTLDISKPAPAAAVSLGSAEIFDDDAGGDAQPTVNVSPTSNFEGTTTGSDPNALTWTISLDAPATSQVRVDYRLLAGTGSVGTVNNLSDVWRGVGGIENTLTFLPGETSQTVSFAIDADNVDETDEAVVLEVFNPEGATLAGDAPVLRATGWVLDDDGTGNDLALFVSRPVLVEGDTGETQASFEVSLSRPAPEAFTVTYTTLDGSAVAGEDYETTSGTLSFVEGQTSASVTVPVFGDTKIEPAELFTLDISKPAPAAAVSLGSAEIFDDDAGGDAQPTVNVSPTSNFEGTTTGSDPNALTWTISLDAPATSQVRVDYRLLAGTGSVGTVNNLSDVWRGVGGIENTLTFLPGETSQTVSFAIDADNVDETDEAVVLEVFNPEGATLAGDAPVLRATGWVLDDDGTGNDLALFVSRPVLVEGDTGETQASFEVSLSRPAPEAFTVTYTTLDGSAVAGEDYETTSGTLSFVEGQTSASVTVPVFGDTKIEPAELFTLDISKPAPAAAVSLGSAEIFDDDAGGDAQPTVNVSPTSNFEGTTTGSDPNALTWTISLDAPATSQVRVDYRLLAGTGSVGTVNNLSDVWRGVGGIENTLTFLPGETSQTVSFAIDADNVDETDEAVVLEVFNPEGATLAGDAPVLRATGWVLDDDGTGNDLALFVSRPVLVEGDTGETQASFEVSLSRPAPEAFTVTYTTLDGSAVAGEDYETTSGTLSFVEGQTSASVTVPVFGDTKIEPAELFTLDISKPAPAAAVSLGSAEIFDDDAGGDAQPTVNVSPTSNFEGTTTGSDPNALTWTISLDAPATSQVRVDYRLLAGTGSVGTVNNLSDVWRGVGGIENTLTFLPGETSQTVSFAIDADNVDETDEAVVLEVFNPEGATLAGDAPVLRATGWVLDDDGTGNDLALFVSRPVLVEGDTGETQASFEVSLSRPAPEAFTVTYTTLDGSAVAGEDYETTSGTLSFVEGQTSASVTVPVFGDTKIEPAELFTLDISKPAPAAAVSLGSAEIFDDDAGGDAQPTVNVSPTSNFEGTTTGSDPNALTWTISLDAPATSQVRVDYRLLAGTGSVGTVNNLSDVWRGVGGIENTLTFLPGETSQTVSFAIDADNVDETDEAVVLEVFNPEGATLAGDAPVLRATGWVLDDDGTGNNLALFVLGPDVKENLPGGSVATFDISLSRPATSDLTFEYTTVNGSAEAGQDYQAKSGTISFKEGQTRTAVNVPIIGDAIIEFNETFTLDVTPTSELASGEAGTDGVGTIVDNDPIVPVATVSLSVSPVSALEGDSGPQTAVTFTLSRSGDLTNAVTATLMAGGSAAAGSDYTGAIPGSLTIPAGATEASFTVTVQGDEDVEGDEEITVTIDDLDRADHGIGTASATHTIEEDPDEGDVPPVAADDAFTTDEDTALAGDLFADNGAGPDSDADGDPFTLTAASVGGAALSLGVATELAGGGRLTVGSDGSLAFDPDGDFETLETGDTATVEISYTIADDDGSDDATAAITIAGVNDAPGITSGAAFTVPENQTAIGSVVATDPEGDTLSYAITGGADAALFDIDPTTGALSFLTAPDFESPADTGGDNVYDLTVAASDGTDSTPQDITVTVTDVEPEPDAATVSLSVSPVSALEGDSGPQTAVTFTLSRSGDLTNAVTATLMAGGSAAAGSDYTGAIPGSLTIPAGATEASFTVTVQGDEDVEGDEEITVTIDDLDRADHGIGTASATHTIEEDPDEGDVPPVAADDAFTTDEDTALAGDLFADNGAGPDSDADGDPFTLTAASVGGAALSLGVATELAGGGRLTVGSDGSLAFDPDGDFETLETGDTATVEISYTIADDDGSDDATAAITIAGVNDAPGITSGAAFTVPENQTAIGSVVATDPEGDTLSYAITGGADAALFDIDPTTGALSFLTAPDFESPADTGGDNVYDLTVAASDGTDSTPQDITVTVTDVEPEPDAATVSLSVSPVSALEGDSGPQTAVTFTLSRSGDLTNAVTATLMAGGSAAAGSDYTGAIPGSLTIPAGATEASFTVTVQGDEDVEGDEEITVTIDDLDRADHGIGTASATHTIEEDPDEGDVPPVAADDAFTTDEDTALAGDLFADNGAGPDSDADGDPFTLTAASVGGAALSLGVATELAGGGRLTVGSDGSLAFDPDGDFETLETGDTATVEISYTIADDDGSDDATAAITIAGVNDAPGITSGAAFTVPENQTAIGSVVATDPEGDTLSYAITGGADAALFDIDPTTGALSFLTAPDFESPADTGGDNVYDLTVAASDGTDSTPQDITVTVTDVEPEPDAATVSLSVSPVSALEGDSGPQTAVTFTLSRSGDLTNAVTATLMAGGSAAAGSDYTGAIPGSLTIPAGATEASFTVTVQGDEDVEGDEEITVTIDDLDRADHGIGTASATHTIEEDPDEGDVPPVAADDAFTTDEDTALAGDLFADNGAGPDSDADGDPFTLTAASVGGAALSLGVATELAGGGRLTVGSDGSLAFDPDGDFETLETGDTATVEISYTIADDDGSDDATAAITIAGVNDAPGITSGAAFTVPENQTAIGSVVATDPEGDTLSYAITGGADAALFDIDPTTGALSFLTAPDFESPADTGGDNVYDLTVAASDGTDSTPQDITVTVTDVEPEGPEPGLIIGTSGIDYLVGTDADERIEGRGGPLDQVIGGGGADVFVFEDQLGSRDVLAIRDFSEAEGDMLDLQGAEIAQEVVAGGSTYLILAGEDRDLIILDGVMGYDDLLLS